MKPMTFALAIAALTLAPVAAAQAQQAVTVQPTLKSIAREVEIARDVQEIQNLMSRRMYFHAAGQNEHELELWSKRDDIRWMQNQGCWGRASLFQAYDIDNKHMQQNDLDRIAKANPAVPDDFATERGVGSMAIHTLTTPIIVVANDLQSAKAVFYTPGAILTTKDGVKPDGFWIWERYGVDLVKEDGQWKFLHIQVNTDFMNPMGEPLQPQGSDAATLGTENVSNMDSKTEFRPKGPDAAMQTYREFGATRVPIVWPRPPEPYKTLKATFEYADCSAAPGGNPSH